MLTDFHIHSTCSSDAHDKMADMALASYDRGVRLMCFTDHVDLDNYSTDRADEHCFDVWPEILRQHAETCAAVYTAFTTGMPLVSRVVTVDGDAVCEPKNIRVPIGTSYEDVFAFCGGLKESAARIISGGPMMGNAQWDYNAVIMKNTSALLVLSDENISVKPENAACIHCGKCVSVCPMHLMPNYLAAFSKADNDEMCEKFSLLSCVECGCCTYTCPARVPIVQLIRNKKAKILAARKKAAAAAADKM